MTVALRACPRCGGALLDLDPDDAPACLACGYRHYTETPLPWVRDRPIHNAQGVAAIEADIVPAGYKRCNRCGDVYPLARFSRASQTADGRRGQCRQCQGAYQREYRARARR